MPLPERLRGLIQGQYEQFSPVDRRMADAVLAREQDVLAYSATELAAQAGVSKASAARFFRRLGFEDYQAFRLHLRNGAASPSPLSRLAQRGGQPSPLMQHLERDALHLQALSNGISDAAVQAAVRLLLDAKRVWVVGYRNGYMAAFYARAVLSQVRGGVALLNDGSGEDAERLADIQSGDVLLAMDFRRRTRRVSQVAAIAAQAGATLVLVSDARVSALAGRAQVVLTCPPQDEPVFDSYVTAISLINFVANTALGAAAKKAKDRMARIEQTHAQLDDLDP